MKLLMHDGLGVWCAARRLNQGRIQWQVREAREAMFNQVAVETQPLDGDVWSFAGTCAG